LPVLLVSRTVPFSGSPRKKSYKIYAETIIAPKIKNTSNPKEMGKSEKIGNKNMEPEPL